MIRGLEWEITGTCNYDCSYCCARGQYGLERRHVTDDVVEAVLSTIGALPGDWLVKFGGAEPTMYPRLLELAGRVVALGRRVSITSNLSKSVDWWWGFVRACGGQLEYVTGSYHPEQVGVEEFCRKVAALVTVLPGLQVSGVVTNDNLGILRPVAERIVSAGAVWRYQVLREGGDFVQYDPVVWEHIEHKLASPLLYAMSHSSDDGCYAGDTFFRVLLNGDCVRCYELGVDDFHLGNVVDGTFERLSGPARCGSPRCTCTVPTDQGARCTSV